MSPLLAGMVDTHEVTPSSLAQEFADLAGVEDVTRPLDKGEAGKVGEALDEQNIDGVPSDAIDYA